MAKRMMRRWQLAATSGLLIAAGAPDTKDSPRSARAGLALAAADDCVAAMVELRPIADGKAATLTDSALRRDVLEAAANCDVAEKKLDTAYNYALWASQFDGSSDQVWTYRLAIEIDTGRIDAALDTAQRLSQERPAVLNGFEPRFYWRIVEKANSSNRADVREAIIALLATRYASIDPFISASEAHLEYAKILAGKGKMEDARAQVSKLSVNDLVVASFDPKLRDIVGSNLNIRQLAENDLAADRQLMRQSPDRLLAVLRVAASLRSLGQQQDALALLLSAKPRLSGPDAYLDASQQTSWWWNSLANSYKLTGNYEAMVRAYREGMSLQEEGGLNVSQVINLAAAQIEMQRPRDAVATLAVFDTPGRKLSAYGELAMRGTRACARALSGEAVNAAVDMQYIRDNGVNSPQSLLAVLLCNGDMEAAAREAIRLLGDDLQSASLLYEMSDFEKPALGVAPSIVTVRTEALKTRPDVKQAIDNAGGIRRISLYRETL